jgi:competence protein ComEA
MSQIIASIKPILTGAKTFNKKLALALLGVVALAAFLINSAFSAASGDALQSGPEESKSSIEASATPSGITAPQIQEPSVYVHLVGEVRNPGLYSVESGARLIDAIIQAGGFTAKADESSINLARILTDGEQIFVLKRGAVSNSASIGGVRSSGTPQSAQISLNRGSQAELEQLPGVGPTLAQRIIDWRTANGGFKSKTDLQNVAGIGDKMFAAIEGQVTL